ncbi:hypothetical protein J6590_101729 [Homalodisca vitripennis]|nr:hypothetical protein J6590_016646 [Homalodisca vitripennis]KAG8324042.1 hypothetical protein J6590_101729 [Homalodisca vitripennis]
MSQSQEGFFGRIWDLNFICKLIALSINIFCIVVWTSGVEYESLPANNEHELALFYHTIPAFTVILSVLLGMFLVGEVPGLTTQKVYIFTGLTLYLIVGTVGIRNSIDNDYPSMMLVMSLMCIAAAATMALDFLKLENFFKPSSGSGMEPSPSELDHYHRYH